jgi:hypothetical protein
MSRWAMSILVVLCLVATGIVCAQVLPVPSDLGEPADFEVVYCPRGKVVLLKFYDFNPPDEMAWRAISMHVGEEQNWFALIVWDSPNPDDHNLTLWIDANRDGRPEKSTRMTDDERREQWTNNPCVYRQKIVGDVEEVGG